MRNIGRRARWSFLAIAVALIAAVWFYLIPSASREERAEQPAPHRAAVAVAAKPAKRGLGTQDPVARTEDPEFSLPRIPPVMQRVLDSNPELAQYYGLE